MNLQVKLKKSAFYITKIKYLGYIILRNGIKIDPEKIRIIIKWLTPKNISEVQFFLGFINFYYRFIKILLKDYHKFDKLNKKGYSLDSK